MRIFNLQNTKNVFTRKCIGEAVIALLKDNELKRLKISDLVLKAGVSRMTFYKYYFQPKDALEDYLQIIISEYITESEQVEEQVPFLTYPHILYALNFFDRYRTFFLTMKKRGLYSILIDSVNAFVSEHMMTDEKTSVYKRYSYAGSLLNCFLMWEETDKQDSAESVARTIYALYGSEPE